MEVIDIFLEKPKDKFLNSLVKIPKEYSWYLGLVTNLTGFNKTFIDNMHNSIREKCDIIYEKSEKHLKLLQILLIDNYTLLLFGIDPEPYENNIRGIVNSICKYIDCKLYEVTYMKYFRDMVFNAWGDQQYKYLICDNKAHNLKNIREGE